MIEQYTFWGMTINNPDENDDYMIKNPPERYIRQLVYTREEGAEGTPHIQAYIRLFRNQTLHFIQRIYPRGHFTPLRKDEYEQNTKNYVQKDDETTRSPHIHINNSVENDAIQVILSVLQKLHDTERTIFDALTAGRKTDGTAFARGEGSKALRWNMVAIEDEMVIEKPYLSRLFVSPGYEKILERFWRQLLLAVKHNNAQLSQASIPKENESQIQTGSFGEDESPCVSRNGSSVGNTTDSD